MVPNPADLNLRTLLNGKIMQNGYADDMIFSIPEIVSHLSKVCTKVELPYFESFSNQNMGIPFDLELSLSLGHHVVSAFHRIRLAFYSQETSYASASVTDWALRPVRLQEIEVYKWSIID